MSIELSNMQRHSVCIAGVVIAAVTCGLWCGPVTAQQPPSDEPRSESQLANDSQAPSQAAKRFWEAANLTSRFQRQSAMFQFVASADANLLHELLWQSDEMSSKQLRDEAQEIVTLRLASLDPVNALAKLGVLEDDRRVVLTQVVFGEWSLSDFDEAVAYATSLDEKGRHAAIRGIINSRGDLPKKDLLSVAEELNSGEIANEAINESMAQREIDDPETALRDFMSGKRGDRFLRKDSEVHLFEHITRSLIEKHGARGALRLVSRAVGTAASRRRTLNVFFDEVAKSSPELALQLGIEMSHGNDERVGGGVVLGLAYIDPVAALESSLSVRDAEQRDILLQVFPLSGSVEKIPESILDVMSRYPDVNGGEVVRRAIRALARKSPDVAVQYLHFEPDEAERMELAKYVVELWSRIDVVSALNWVNTSNEFPEFQQRLIPSAIKELVYTDAQLAFETALELETTELGIGPEAGVLEELAINDVTTAISMLGKTRNRETRLSASKSVARALIRDGDSARVIEIGNGFAASSQDDYFQSLIGEWVLYDGKGLYESLRQLPTAEIQSAAAKSLLASHSSRRGIRLTQDQQQVVQALVSDDAKAKQQSNTEDGRDWEYVLFRN